MKFRPRKLQSRLTKTTAVYIPQFLLQILNGKDQSTDLFRFEQTILVLI